MNPKIAILLLSLFVTIITTIVNYFLTDRELMRKIKEKQKGLRQEMKLHKGNPQKMMEINQKMMEDFPIQMKQSFKIMLITMVPLFIFFNWLRSSFAATDLASSWFWWYLVASLVFSIALRKLFKLD